jgi:hypothetical protein
MVEEVGKVYVCLKSIDLPGTYLGCCLGGNASLAAFRHMLAYFG